MPRQQLLDFIQAEHTGDTGIVYCLSRKKVEETAEWLYQKGLRALPYHAGMSNELRQKNQHQFLMEDGLIIVATIAFGMGIDKPNVRYVAHLDLPKSVEVLLSGNRPRRARWLARRRLDGLWLAGCHHLTADAVGIECR